MINVKHDKTSAIIITISTDIALIFQSIVLIPSLFTLNKRLRTMVPRNDIKHFAAALPLCYWMLAFSLLTGATPQIYDMVQTAHGETLARQLTTVPGFLAAQIGISCILSANMMFVSADMAAASELLEDLQNKAVDQSLSTEDLSRVRAAIREKVEDTSYINSSMVLIALVNVVVILIELLLAFQVFSVRDTLVHLLLFVKELPYLWVIFMRAARVNEQADQLCATLGSPDWNAEPNLLRLSLYADAQSRRISFPLAGMRLVRKDVYLRFGAWALAFLASLFRLVVFNSV